MALLEVALDGQLSLIWDLYHLRVTTEKLDMGKTEDLPPFSRFRISKALGPARPTPPKQ